MFAEGMGGYAIARYRHEGVGVRTGCKGQTRSPRAPTRGAPTDIGSCEGNLNIGMRADMVSGFLWAVLANA